MAKARAMNSEGSPVKVKLATLGTCAWRKTDPEHHMGETLQCIQKVIFSPEVAEGFTKKRKPSAKDDHEAKETDLQLGH